MGDRLSGKVAVVTGGGSGIGRGCALRFAEEGAAVVVGDLHPERAEVTLEAVRERGARGLFVQTDVSREAECERLAEAAVAEFGRVDVLLAAAGIPHPDYVSREDGAGSVVHNRDEGALLAMPLATWERVLAVNLTGMMLADRAIARRMLARGEGGSIVNIASIAGAIPRPGRGDYSVSKAGVIMLTKVLALELAPHQIRVNAIGPGMIATPMNAARNAVPELLERRIREIPIGRAGEPVDIANPALFLASDEAGYVTGEILFVDGGTFTG